MSIFSKAKSAVKSAVASVKSAISSKPKASSTTYTGGQSKVYSNGAGQSSTSKSITVSKPKTSSQAASAYGGYSAASSSKSKPSTSSTSSYSSSSVGGQSKPSSGGGGQSVQSKPVSNSTQSVQSKSKGGGGSSKSAQMQSIQQGPINSSNSVGSALNIPSQGISGIQGLSNITGQSTYIPKNNYSSGGGGSTLNITNGQLPQGLTPMNNSVNAQLQSLNFGNNPALNIPKGGAQNLQGANFGTTGSVLGASMENVDGTPTKPDPSSKLNQQSGLSQFMGTGSGGVSSGGAYGGGSITAGTNTGTSDPDYEEWKRKQKMNTTDKFSTITGEPNPDYVDPNAPEPIDPMQAQLDVINKQFEEAQKYTPKELADQEAQIALNEKQRQLAESYNQGDTAVENKVIPMEFITGQRQNLLNQFNDANQGYNNQQATLQDKLALAQSRRQAAIDSAKSSLNQFNENRNYELNKQKMNQTSAPEGFTLGEGQQRFDANGNLLASGSPKAGTGTGIDANAQAWAQGVQSGQYKIEDVPSEYRNSVVNALSGLPPKTSEISRSVLTSIGDLLNNQQLSRITGSLDRFLGGNFGGAALAKNQYNQLKGLLSLENIKYLKGTGAISDAEQRLLANASTTLGRNLSNENFRKELIKLQQGLMAESQKGSQSSSGGGGLYDF